MVEVEIILLANGFFLSAILLIMLIFLANQTSEPPQNRKRVREDIRKIKEQVENTKVK